MPLRGSIQYIVRLPVHAIILLTVERYSMACKPYLYVYALMMESK